jgi:hypothetical protein
MYITETDNNLKNCHLKSNQKFFSCILDEKIYQKSENSFLFQLVFNAQFQMSYNISNFGSIKLHPPQSIITNSTTEPIKAISVSWRVSNLETFPHKIIYEVGYKTKFDENWIVAMTSQPLNYKSTYSTEFKYTYSGIEHCIRVRHRVMHSNSDIKSYWSDFAYNPSDSNDCAYIEFNTLD